MARKKASIKQAEKTNNTLSGNYLERLEKEIQSNQSKVSLILGALIILVIGILFFNYFTKNQASLGPAQQTDQQADQKQDVSPDALPGKYTVKEGDTLFTIAEKYYQDGKKFTEIVKANNLTNPDQIETGQIIEIPSPSPEATEESLGTGGGNSTIWGDRIEGNTYTVVDGDWLSTIAGRAYGDIMAYKRLVEANNIQNPDHIESGQVLTIPR